MTTKPLMCGDCSRFNDELRLCDGLPIPRPDWFDYATSKPTCARDQGDPACSGGAFSLRKEEPPRDPWADWQDRLDDDDDDE